MYKSGDIIDKKIISTSCGEHFLQCRIFYNLQHYGGIQTVEVQFLNESMKTVIPSVSLNELRNLALFLINVAEKVDNANKN